MFLLWSIYGLSSIGYKLNKQNSIVKKLMELDDAISEYFALKHCNPETCSSNDISKAVGPSQDLIKSMVEHENDSQSDKRDGREELLLAQ